MSEVRVQHEPTSPKGVPELQPNMSWGRAQSPGSPRSVGSFEGKNQPIGGTQTSTLRFSVPPQISEKDKHRMIKSEFMRTSMLAQKKTKPERVRQMTDEEFLRSEFYESKLKSIMEEDESVYPKQLAEPDPVVLTGAHTVVKKKFCGNTVVTEYVDIRITRDKEVAVTQSLIYGQANKIPQAELDKIKSMIPREMLSPDTIQLRRVDDVNQELNISKVGGNGGKQDQQIQKLFIPQGSRFEYIIPGKIANHGKLDIFVKDIQQGLETTKVLTTSKIYGSQFTSQFAPTAKSDIRPFIQVWKGRICESVMEILQTKQTISETKMAIQQELFPRTRRNIRLGVLKSIIKNAIKNGQTEVTKRLAALRSIYMTRNRSDNRESLKIGLELLRGHAASLRRFRILTVEQPTSTSMRPASVPAQAVPRIELEMIPTKLFLSPYTKPNVSSPIKDLLERLTNPDFQIIDELEILVSPKDLTPEEIHNDYKIDHFYKVEKIPFPYSSDLPVREFDLVMKQNKLDLKDCLNHYLVVYLKNLEDGKVWAHGSCIVLSDMGNRRVVDLEDPRGNKVGTVVFKNLKYESESTLDQNLIRKQMPCIQELTHPSNFGYMKKLDSAVANDRGLFAITGNSSTKQEYEKLKLKMMRKVQQTADLIEYEEKEFRTREWADFEQFFKESADYARRENQRHTRPNFTDTESVPILNQPVQTSSLAPARQHSLRRGVSEYQPRLPADEFVLERNEFRQRADRLDLKIPAQIDTDSSMYLYNCLIPWELTLKNKGHLEVLERALNIGIPTPSLIRVWKSVGKTMLAGMIVHNVCLEMLPSFEPNNPLLSQLAAYRSQSTTVSANIISMIGNLTDLHTSDEKNILLKVMQAFCNLRNLMKQLNDRFLNQGPLRQALAGFNLIEPSQSTVKLVRHIIRVASMTHNTQAVSMGDAIEQDVFWILTTLAFVVLPEQFLEPEPEIQQLVSPKPEGELTQAMAERQTSIVSYIKKLDNMGTSLEKLFRKRASGLALTGTHKLASLFAQLVYKELPAVYYAMAELGFPFTQYASEVIDSLFVDDLNLDTLNKLWSVMFFEGASSRKRRSQQVMLSALVARIHLVKKPLLESKSVDEMMWYLKAAMAEIHSSEFIQRVRCLQRKHFISTESNVSLISEIGKFVKGNKSMEENWKEIETEYKQALLPLRMYLSGFQDQIKIFIESAKQMTHVDLEHLKAINKHFIVQPNLSNGTLQLKFLNDFTKDVSSGKDVSAKKSMLDIRFGLASWDFGDYLPRGSRISIESSLKRDSILMEINQKNWYIMHSVPGSKDQTTSHATLMINLELVKSDGTYAKQLEMVHLTDFDYNQDGFFHVRSGNAVFCFFVRTVAAENNARPKNYFETLIADPQIRQNLFSESLANQLKIPKVCTYENELIQSELGDLTHLETMMNYFFRVKDVKLTDNFKKVLSQNLLNSMKPNLFELLVTLILATPRTRLSAIEDLFGVLNKLDQSYSENTVKTSHTAFLIWYMARLSGMVHPLHEINREVRHVVNRGETQVLMGFIKPLDNSQSPSLDVTELLNIWVSAERKRGGRGVIVLGEAGYLNRLEAAITFWQQETGMQPHKYAISNKLSVLVRTAAGSTNNFEFRFDKQMRLTLDHKSLEIPVEIKHALLIDDTPRVLGFETFFRLMESMSLVPKAFGRLEVGDALLTVEGVDQRSTLVPEAPVPGYHPNQVSNLSRSTAANAKLPVLRIDYAFKDNPKQVIAKVAFEVGSSSGSVEEKGLKHFAKILQIYRDQESHLSETINGSPAGEVKVRIASEHTPLESVVKKGIRVCIEQFLSQLDPENMMKHSSNQIVQLVGSEDYSLEYEFENTVWHPNQELLSLRQFWKSHRHPASLKLTVTVSPRVSPTSAAFTRFAKNIYDMEGAAVVDNPLSPCIVLHSGGTFSLVLFSGSSFPPVLIPTDQLI